MGTFRILIRVLSGGPSLGMFWIWLGTYLLTTFGFSWGAVTGLLTSNVCSCAAWLEKSRGDCWHSWQTWEICRERVYCHHRTATWDLASEQQWRDPIAGG